MDGKKALQVGDIIYYSWGYDQTNVDFFQVIKTTAKSATIRPIKGKTIENGFMSGNTTAIKGAFDGDAITKRIKEHNGEQFFVFDYGIGRLWDGRPVSCSWYA